MLFGSLEKWWAGKERRESPHEGLDICFFRDRDGQVCKLREESLVPILYSGTVAKITDDFLGRTVFCRHEEFSGTAQLYTIYGHVKERDDLAAGALLCAGDIFASLAGASKRKIPPHLHLTIAWIPPGFPYEDLSWGTISKTDGIFLEDPMDAILLKYSLL